MLPLDKFLYENSGKKIIFLGRGELFSSDEYERFLKKNDIKIVKEIDEDVVAIIEHHRISHVEELVSCDAYVRNIPIYKLQEFEELMSLSLVDSHVLMALKLSNDQQRIYQLLNNPYINDSLFNSLIALYKWDDDVESDNNQDRGVVIATLRRYLDFKPNEEDLLYSPMSLSRLAKETQESELLKTLLYFPDYKFLQKGKQWVTLREVIANSPYIDRETIDKLISFRNKEIPFYLAANPATPIEILKKFSNSQHEIEIDEALASNTSIDHLLFTKLLSKRGSVRDTLLTYQPIDMKRFHVVEALQIDTESYAHLGENLLVEESVLERLVKRDNSYLQTALADNPSLSSNLLEKIYNKGIPAHHLLLAGNPSFAPELLEELFITYPTDERVLIALAGNPSTPVYILEKLFKLEKFEINEGLASNESLPLELLNILKIDTRLRSALTNNKTFTDSITQAMGL